MPSLADFLSPEDLAKLQQTRDQLPPQATQPDAPSVDAAPAPAADDSAASSPAAAGTPSPTTPSAHDQEVTQLKSSPLFDKFYADALQGRQDSQYDPATGRSQPHTSPLAQSQAEQVALSQLTQMQTPDDKLSEIGLAQKRALQKQYGGTAVPPTGMGDSLAARSNVSPGEFEKAVAAVQGGPSPAASAPSASSATGTGTPGTASDDSTGDDDSTAAPKSSSVADQLAAARAAMAGAQGAANSNTFIANMARAEGQLAHSIAGAPGKMDESMYNALEANANAPVTNLQNMNKNDTQNLQMQQALMATTAEAGASDPASKASQMARQFWQKVLPPGMTNSPDYAQMSANDIKAYIQQPAEFMAKMEATRAVRAQHLDEVDYRHLQAEQNSLNHETQKASDALHAADSALGSIEMARTNPVAAGAVPIEMARSLVSGGRVNAIELQKMGGSQAVLDHLAQMGKEMQSGTLTDSNYQWFTGLAQHMKNAAQADMQDITFRHARQRSVNAGKSVDDAYYDLTGNKAPTQTGTASGHNYKAGDRVSYKGKHYIVGDDGNTLNPAD